MEFKNLKEEEIIDNVSENILIFIFQLYPYIAPENFENSTISTITNEQLSIKISDLLNQPEISKYITNKEELISLIQKYCEFFSLTEDKESVKYILPEGMTVFSILNIPPKYNKEEVKNDIELINLQYNRLYKNGFYWILSTTDKETIICVQNSLRELIFDEVRIKFIHHNKNQILKNMKDKLDKNSYQKDTKFLGINDGYGKNKYYKGEDNFAWRKGSGWNKSSFDYGDKYYYKKGGYYKYKRNRYNSGDDWKKYKNYQYQNYYNKNNQEIEIDISNLKYDLNIKNKYTFGEIKNYLQKYIEKSNMQKPQFQNEDVIDIISKSKKEIVALDELIESNEKNKMKDNNSNSNKKQNKNDNNNFNNTNNNINNNVIPNIKIPKMNPLSGMSKAYNKFDIIPGNAMTGYMMPFPAPFSIAESNKEE